VRIHDQTLREFFADPEAIHRLCYQEPERFRELIKNDASAEGLVALVHLKKVVQRFRQLLGDDAAGGQGRVRWQAGGGLPAVSQGEPVDIGHQLGWPAPQVLGRGIPSDRAGSRRAQSPQSDATRPEFVGERPPRPRRV
jgi:hypothetical protein